MTRRKRIPIPAAEPVHFDLEEIIAREFTDDPGEGKAHLLEDGREVFNPVPVAPPIGYKKQQSMVEIVRDMVRSERLKQEVEAAGYESFEEADDFDVGDDAELPLSAYEAEFEPASELRRKAAEAAEAEKEVEEEPPPAPSPPEPLKKPAKGEKAPPPRAEPGPKGPSEGGPL